MSIVVQEREYEFDGRRFDGAIARDDALTGDVPAVLVFHGWEGRSSAQEAIAGQLAELGYAGIACDLFGDGVRGAIDGDNTQLIEPLLADRVLLRDRLAGAVGFAREQPGVDRSRIAAIGFCFGGLCALDLARSGADVRAVASFHGMLHRPEQLPITPIPASVAVFHGWDDPMAPPDDLVALGRELTEAGADWQVHAYGNTMHAFMAVGVNQPERGIQYNERSARRAWLTLEAVLTDAFTA